MKGTIDSKLDEMALSLQEQIRLAKELKLDFVAHLLSVAAMEVQVRLHGISAAEMEILCAHAEDRVGSRARRESARVIDFPGRSRRS